MKSTEEVDVKLLILIKLNTKLLQDILHYKITQQKRRILRIDMIKKKQLVNALKTQNLIEELHRIEQLSLHTKINSTLKDFITLKLRKMQILRDPETVPLSDSPQFSAKISFTHSDNPNAYIEVTDNLTTRTITNNNWAQIEFSSPDALHYSLTLQQTYGPYPILPFIPLGVIPLLTLTSLRTLQITLTPPNDLKGALLIEFLSPSCLFPFKQIQLQAETSKNESLKSQKQRYIKIMRQINNSEA